MQINNHDTNRIVKTPLYWDCECEHNYIHKIDVKVCSVCGMTQSEMPESRVNEVWDMILKKFERKILVFSGLANLNGGNVIVKVLSKDGWQYKTNPIRIKYCTEYCTEYRDEHVHRSEWIKATVKFEL